MSEQYEKYLKSLPKKEREKIKFIINQILSWNLDNIKYKELEGKKWFYRTKYKDLRIIFSIQNWNYKIVKILPRWDIYKHI